MYGIEGVKALANALESVSDLIPLPFLSTFLKVGVKVLEACEEATDIEENAADLQRRVYNLVLVVVDTVPVNRMTSLELRERIKKLQIILDSILSDMDKLKEQRKWLQVLFHDRNKERVDKCVARLNAALEQFNIAGQLRVEESQLRVEDLLDKIKADYSAFAAQLNRIEDAVKETTRPHNAPSARPRQDMPMPHHIFYGRDGLVDEITSLLVTESTSRVCITGVGGMGKTSVALAVTETTMVKNTFLKEYIFWVPCIEAKSSDLLRHILYAQLRITAESYDSLDPLIAELDTSKQRRLLLLDNFETPWLFGQDQDRVKVDDILVRLAKLPHIALLVTMTSGFTPGDVAWQHRPLPALDLIAARDAFKSKYRVAAGGHELTADGPELDEFLTSIGQIPLAITLTAASSGRLGSSPDDLLREWGKAGTAMMSGNEKQSMDKTIGLSMEREAVKSNPQALTLLAILSMLPAGTIGNHLDWWAPTLTSLPAAVETLRLAALIEKDDGPFATSRIFVLPTIQAYMAHQDRIPAKVRDQVHDACYKFVLDHKSIPDDHKFKDDLTALAAEETNIQGILMEVDANTLRPNAVDALIAFSFYQSYTKPSTAVAAHALRVALAAHDDPRVADLDAAARRVAEAYRCLGQALLSLDRYDKACKLFQEARARFKGLYEADLCCAGECSRSLLRTRIYLGTDASHELESLAEEARADLCHDETKKYYVARGLLGFGHFLWWATRWDEALETLSAAQAIFEELDCPASTAECLLLVARVYARRHQYPEALRIARNGLVKAEQSGEIGVTCRILRCIAAYLILEQFYDDALVAITRFLTLCQAFGSAGGMGQGLELLAYSCAARLDLQGARAAYSGAQVQFRKTELTASDRAGVARCSDNLAELGRLTEMTQNDFSKLAQPDLM
ncbi:hypothetical protein DFH08DRAFT_886738 [Mycena albidolilacea]|uniref:NACHT domain-containing protein n=1 Tax=Mycena albidolilacea TaxID=1033008 RepID=A0AAD6ZJG4_9AGAR|nr:hypothetical protein DFH08DRAFT_886738 [Mycena albidolilacea]